MTEPIKFRGKKDSIGRQIAGTNETCGHVDLPHYGRGMCRLCYKHWWVNSRKADCHPDRPHFAKGKCETCDSRRRSRLRSRKARKEAIKYLGGLCRCCGENRKEFLSISHPDGDGKEHREETGNQRDIYEEISKGKCNRKVEVLCYNCHFAEEYYGACPHKEQE